MIKKLNPTVLSIGLAAGVITYYGAANLFLGEISNAAFWGGMIFSWGCAVIVYLYGRKYEAPTTNHNSFLNFSIIPITIFLLYFISIIDYLPAGRLLGLVMGGLTGALIFSRDKKQLFNNTIIYKAILGVLLFVILRDIGFDVQTMASTSLEPRIHQGQQVFISDLSFGLRVPFLPYHIIKWGKPEIGDFVVVAGPKGNPYLREVLFIKGKQVFLNVDGWLPEDSLLARGTPLRKMF